MTQIKEVLSGNSGYSFFLLVLVKSIKIFSKILHYLFIKVLQKIWYWDYHNKHIYR